MGDIQPIDWSRKYIQQFIDTLVIALKPAFTADKDLKHLTLDWWLTAVRQSLKADWAGIIQFSKIANEVETLSITSGWPINFTTKDLLPILTIKGKEPFVLESKDEIQKYLIKFEAEIHNLTIKSIEYLTDAELQYFLVIGNQKKNKSAESELPTTLIPPIFLLSQFSGLIMLIQNNCLEAWQNSLYAGSRTSIRNRARNLLSEHSDGLTQNILDQVQASEIDASVILEIVPHMRTTTTKKEIAKDKQQNYLNSNLPLTRLASLRRDIWQSYRYGNSIHSISDDWQRVLHELQENFMTRDETTVIPYMPEFIGSLLNTKITQRVWSFSHQNYKRIELLRTCLFLLHYLAYSIEGVADKTDISSCDDAFQTRFQDKTLTKMLADLIEDFLGAWGEDEKLIITSEWLIIWFGLKLLNSENLLDDDKFRRYTPNQRAKFYRHFAVYFLYILFLVRYFGEPSLFRFSDVPNGYENFVESALFLLAEYAHEVEGLSVSIPLYQIISHIWSNEAILYTIHEGYRDHHHHVWNICLLGLVLIEAGFMKKLGSTNKNGLNWILASLLHDIGYSISLNRHIVSHLRYLQTSSALEEFQKTLQTSFSTAEESLCKKLDGFADWCSLGTKINSLDHGVVSAVYLLFLDQIEQKNKERNQPSEKWHKEIKEALEAIGKHNLMSTKISPTSSPLSFLLLLCDHLQEWDRPRLRSDRLRRYVSLSLQRPGQVATTGSTLVQHLQTNLLWKDGKVMLPKGKVLNFTLLYKDAYKEGFEPAIIWCENTHQFQRVNLENWPDGFEIHFTAKHPLSENLKAGTSLLEMDLFEDYAAENETCRGFSSWFSAARAGSQGFTYKADKGMCETFSWVFKENYTKYSCIDHIPADLYNRYVIWKEQQLRAIKLRKRKV